MQSAVGIPPRDRAYTYGRKTIDNVPEIAGVVYLPSVVSNDIDRTIDPAMVAGSDN